MSNFMYRIRIVHYKYEFVRENFINE